MANIDPRGVLFPAYVDQVAEAQPEAIYAEFPNHPLSYDYGFRKITYRDLANAINGVAKWLIETLGPGQDEVLAYFGPTDVRYPALVFGALKAGYVMYLPSPRNSPAAHRHLLQTLNCTKLLVTTPRPPPVAGIIAAAPLDVFELPGVNDLLGTTHPHIPFTKTYPAAADERCVIVHTSGSTGIPKPIIWTHESIMRYYNMAGLAAPEGDFNQCDLTQGKRQFLCLPAFHSGGLASLSFMAVPSGMTSVCPISGIPTAAGMVAALKKTPFDVALVPPSVILELAAAPDLLDYVSQHMSHLGYCGGDLPQAVGELVASRIPLINHYGASEMGMLHLIQSPHRDPLTDWGYVQVHPGLGIEFRPTTATESELVMVHRPELTSFQMPPTIFPGIEEYHSQDLFVRHPDPAKADLWRWSARLDDIITFLNGEKTNPISMEQHIVASNPDVSVALPSPEPPAARRRHRAAVAQHRGRQRRVPGPRPHHQDAHPVHQPGQALPRSGKGTAQRAATLALYAPELDALYADADTLTVRDGPSTGPGPVDDPAAISAFIETSLLAVTGWTPDALSAESFFHSGLDSLQILTLSRTLRNGLQLPEIIPNLIYRHPNCNPNSNPPLLLLLLPSPSQPQTIILTGSTGTLGSYLLAALLNNPNISHIHCLNRNPSACSIQQSQALKFHLPALSPSDPRLTFHTTDLTRPDLGLSPSTLQTLRTTTTTLIHNAWTVNWLLPLQFFKPLLTATLNLLNFCADAPSSPHFFFLSTVGSVTPSTSPSIPEQIVTTTLPAANAYSNSKYIAEHLIASATARSPSLRASIARVGQVAGAVRAPGLWSRTEWFPSLVRSAAHLRALPDSLGPMSNLDWVPIDLLADVLVELAVSPVPSAEEEEEEEEGSEGKGNLNVYHPHNTHKVQWTTLLPTIASALPDPESSSSPMETIPLAEWRARVAADVAKTAGDAPDNLQIVLERNPAAKLADFWSVLEGVGAEGSVMVFETERTQRVSGLLGGVEGVKGGWVEKWVGEWFA
ncbi:acetyl-CoA synthetase-like protein [Aspergillus heteromorphus CBS 117.55]|uniref:Acetyl-CoA synthetase-like protein n=1 Tax=Aspergillus heteromorphus CBS 117.55 TaxID=1448321 RepID=A0A317W8K7_9EURO|nr:acetyl-CoA synthetase-like protein [Aspergillus heteromorphus CBS 117.55]PWY82061.1 acetyl-CoA synthetase-like protein [Aspergillus heteromorphus CBS 117.55]